MWRNRFRHYEEGRLLNPPSQGAGYVVDVNDQTGYPFTVLYTDTPPELQGLYSFDVETVEFPEWRQNLLFISKLLVNPTTTCIATNFQKAIAMPSFANGTFVGVTYQPWSQQLADTLCAVRQRWIAWGREWPL